LASSGSEGPMNVFVSYARRDGAAVEIIVEDL
jgi:hypothetical protein